MELERLERLRVSEIPENLPSVQVKKKKDGSNLALRVGGTALMLLGIAATIGTFVLVVKVDNRWGYALPFTFATGLLGLLLLKAENEAMRQKRIEAEIN